MLFRSPPVRELVLLFLKQLRLHSSVVVQGSTNSLSCQVAHPLKAHQTALRPWTSSFIQLRWCCFRIVFTTRPTGFGNVVGTWLSSRKGDKRQHLDHLDMQEAEWIEFIDTQWTRKGSAQVLLTYCNLTSVHNMQFRLKTAAHRSSALKACEDGTVPWCFLSAAVACWGHASSYGSAWKGQCINWAQGNVVKSRESHPHQWVWCSQTSGCGASWDIQHPLLDQRACCFSKLVHANGFCPYPCAANICKYHSPVTCHWWSGDCDHCSRPSGRSQASSPHFPSSDEKDAWNTSHSSLPLHLLHCI